MYDACYLRVGYEFLKGEGRIILSDQVYLKIRCTLCWNDGKDGSLERFCASINLVFNNTNVAAGN